MDRKCGQTVELGCPPYSHSVVSTSAGTLRYNPVPTGNCTVNIVTTIAAGNCSTTPTWYMNIKKSWLSAGAALHILLTDNGQDWTTVKSIPGGRIPIYPNPTSAAQLKTRVTSHKTQLSIVYIGDGRNSSYEHELLIDYAILIDDSSATGVWCSALGGYVHEDIACNGEDRVTCPENYDEVVDRNPAYDFGACGLDGFDIFGIVVGCAFGLLFLGLGLTCWYCIKNQY
ncbi:uncharacterized protein LOC129592856 isoform X2 [Paramacrobiotus metropolitanus]|nr:uncharacterized protein LOC129592856 isoform X2 [Paramacrobiotus metropolitanus]